MLALIVFHLAHFTLLLVDPGYAGYHTDLHGTQVHDVYRIVIVGFRNLFISLFYIFSLALLANHARFLPRGWEDLRVSPGCCWTRNEWPSPKSGRAKALAVLEFPRRVEERLRMFIGGSGKPALFDRVEVRAGRPFHQISLAAIDLGSDLIVLSKHGHTGLSYMLLGTTAERAIRRAPCPVLAVCKEARRAPKPRSILVPVDFSPSSLNGLRYALALARAFGAKLTVEHVLERLGPLARFEIDVRALEKKLRKGAQLRLEELHLEVNAPEGSFETLVANGASYHEIVKAAERGDFDLVIMASLGRSGSADMLLGSRTERVVRHAPCPLLVVHELRQPRGPST